MGDIGDLRWGMLLAILGINLVILNSHSPKTEGQLVVNHRGDLNRVKTAILAGKTRGPVGAWMGVRSGSVPAVLADAMVKPLWRKLTAFCRTTIVLEKVLFNGEVSVRNTKCNVPFSVPIVQLPEHRQLVSAEYDAARAASWDPWFPINNGIDKWAWFLTNCENSFFCGLPLNSSHVPLDARGADQLSPMLLRKPLSACDGDMSFMLAAEEMDAFLFEPGVPDPQTWGQMMTLTVGGMRMRPTCQLGLRPLSVGAPPIPNMLADAGVNLLCDCIR